MVAKPALIPWANNLGLQGIKYQEVTKRQANIGSLTHYFISCEIKNEDRDTALLSDYTLEELTQAEKYFQTFLKWKEKNSGMEFLHSELALVSYLGYGGTIDAIVRENNRTYILDFKTSPSIYPEHKAQVAAYAHLAYQTFSIDGVKIIRLGEDSYEVWESENWFEIYDWLKFFKLCLDLYSLQRRLLNENQKS
ncbi:MAG: PD-(D/E)XK nuclease family protein [bacterium]